MAVAVREVVPAGVDAVLDAALTGPPVLGAIRDGGQLMTVRPFSGETERDIKVSLVLVFNHLHEGETLARLAELAARRFQAGGVRGRLMLTF